MDLIVSYKYTNNCFKTKLNIIAINYSEEKGQIMTLKVIQIRTLKIMIIISKKL